MFRARDTKLQRNVALKLLPEHFADDPDSLSRFRREAQVLAALNHPTLPKFTVSKTPAIPVASSWSWSMARRSRNV